jgi:transcriptional regulator with XRE-family HTH domain
MTRTDAILAPGAAAGGTQHEVDPAPPPITRDVGPDVIEAIPQEVAPLRMLAEFGQRIRKLRVERRMTLKQLEEGCGLSATHLSEIERGRTSPTVGALIRIARSLAKEPAFFLEIDERGDAANGLRGEIGMLTLAEGVTAQPLTRGIPGSSLFLYLVRLEPGTRLTLDQGESGEVICYVRGGVAHAFSGTSWRRIATGDALHASPRAPQTLHASADEPAEVIVILNWPLEEEA